MSPPSENALVDIISGAAGGAPTCPRCWAEAVATTARNVKTRTTWKYRIICVPPGFQCEAELYREKSVIKTARLFFRNIIRGRAMSDGIANPSETLLDTWNTLT